MHIVFNEIKYGPKEDVENVDFGLTTEDCSSIFPGWAMYPKKEATILMRLESAVLLVRLFDMGNKEKSRKMSGERAHALLMEDVAQYDWHDQVIMRVARVKGVFGMTTANHQKLIRELSDGQAQGVDEGNDASLLLEENVREVEIAIATVETIKDTEEHTIIETRDEL
jgi:hypothetical protein